MSPHVPIPPALASPEKIGEMVALLLVRPEIKSASDFAKQVVAVDELEKAIVASGAFHIRWTEILVRRDRWQCSGGSRNRDALEAAEKWNAWSLGLQRLSDRTAVSSSKGKARIGDSATLKPLYELMTAAPNRTARFRN